MIDFHNFTIKNRFFIGNVSSVIDNFILWLLPIVCLSNHFRNLLPDILFRISIISFFCYEHKLYKFSHGCISFFYAFRMTNDYYHDYTTICWKVQVCTLLFGRKIHFQRYHLCHKTSLSWILQFLFFNIYLSMPTTTCRCVPSSVQEITVRRSSP